MTKMAWLVCQGCRKPFRYPASGWRSHCISCGDDDETNLSALAAFVALVDLVLLFLWYWS